MSHMKRVAKMSTQKRATMPRLTSSFMFLMRKGVLGIGLVNSIAAPVSK